MENQSISEKSKPALVVSLLLLSAVSSFWMLPSMSLDSHECFVSVTAREMLQRNVFLWPTLNGYPRLEKTPLGYWLVAAAGKLTGTVDEFSARLPSAVFAFLSAVAILYYLSRWLSLRIAVLSAAVWSTSLAYIRCSHSARPDIIMSFFILLCMFSFYSVVTSQNRGRQVIHALIFWVSFALANLAKGPAPVVYVSVPLVAYIAFTRNWRIIGRCLPIIGGLIFLVIVLPWPLFIAHRLNWDMMLWKHEFFDRFLGEYAPGNYPIYYYFLIMFKYITPWAVFLPVALAAVFFRVWAEKRPIMIYLWIWFIANFVFLTIDGGKRQHYILPTIPAMSVLIGILLDDMIFSRKVYPVGFTKNILRIHLVLLSVGALVVLIIVFFSARDLFGSVLLFSAVLLAWMITATVLFARHKPWYATITVFSGVMISTMLSFYSFSGPMNTNRHARDFARTIAQTVPASEQLIAYGDISSRFVQYYGKVVPEISDISELEQYYSRGCWIVVMSDLAQDLEDKTFQIVYSEEKDSPYGKQDSAGILIHKSASDTSTPGG